MTEQSAKRGQHEHNTNNNKSCSGCLVIANKLEDLSINEGVECSDQTMASCFAVVARQQCAFYLAGITQSTQSSAVYVQTIPGLK